MGETLRKRETAAGNFRIEWKRFVRLSFFPKISGFYFLVKALNFHVSCLTPTPQKTHFAIKSLKS